MYNGIRSIGSFIEKDCNLTHDYGLNEDDMTGTWEQFPHVLFTNDGIRYANVKKTVAYIAVNEDKYGAPVVEKWSIRSLVEY